MIHFCGHELAVLIGLAGALRYIWVSIKSGREWRNRADYWRISDRKRMM
jgi:hypothetical protein